MNKLLQLLNKNLLTLIVKIPDSTKEMAEAAIEGGADALLVEEIIDAKVPIGIEITKVSEKSLKNIAQSKIDFIIVPQEQIQSLAKEIKKLTKVLSLDEKYSIDKLVELGTIGADAVEAKVLSQSSQKELMVGDLQQYITIVLSVGKPVIIPTQRAIRPSEVAIIHDTGAKGLLIDSAVIGKTPQSIKKATEEYREAINVLEA